MDTEIKKIPIYMHQLLTNELEEQISLESDRNPFVGANFQHEYFGPQSRWLLSAVLASLDLSLHDEIAILTTSNETYVTICVSIPAFNYAKISRVITEKTKVVIVIHEFGFVFPDIETQVKDWQAQGIIVIEDCAHIIGIEVNNKTIGSFGDYALFSLTKVIPGKASGLLRTNHPIKLPKMDQAQIAMTEMGMQAAERYISKYWFFNKQRLKNSKLLSECLTPRIKMFEPSQISIPYFFAFMHPNKTEIQQRINWVEWGPTLRDDLVYVPTNPLVSEWHFANVVAEVVK